MTSVPKPLKFLRPLYPDMVTIHDSWLDNADKVSPISQTFKLNDIELAALLLTITRLLWFLLF